MNKTVSINLGGLYFHIDEDAYQKLNRYFDAIRRSLSPDAKDEIMSDIEGRIAELLSEKLKNEKQVVGVREVEEIVAIMGQPEDYRIDDDTTGDSTYKETYAGAADYAYPRAKKFFRDGERGMVGGVCAGLSHYFRIDPLWIRIVFVLSLFISFGTSIFIYILLWVLIPKAITTTEKLEMTGEPINISNIERKVREEIHTLSSKFKDVDYDKLGANAKYGAEKIGSGIGTVFSAIFKVIAKIIGAFITIFAAVALGAVFVLFLCALFTSSINNPGWISWLSSFNYTDTPVALMATVTFFAVAIPLLMLFLLGLKILVDNLRPIGNITKFTLLGIWLISVAALIFISVRQVSEVTHEGKTVTKQELRVLPTDTIQVKFRYNNYFSKSFGDTDFRFETDEKGNEVIFSNNIQLYIMKTDESMPFIQIEKVSNGKSFQDARARATNINYGFSIEGNVLSLDNYLLTDIHNKFRNQKVEVYLYLPEGALFRCDENVQRYDWSSDDFFNLWWDDSSHIYKVGKTNVDCLTCPDEPVPADVPEPPAPPVPDQVSINANGKGEIHIVNDDVDMHVTVDSVNVMTKRKK